MERIGESKGPDRQPLRVIRGVGEVAVPSADIKTKPLSRQFIKADELLHTKAEFFYGMRGGVQGTPMGRFRILDKGMSAVMKLRDHPACLEWRNNFDTVRTIKQGEEHRDSKLMQTVIDDAGEQRTVWITAGQALQRPDVRSAITERYMAQEDPAMHMVHLLRTWQEGLPIQPLPKEVEGANRDLDKFLFSVHGSALVRDISEVLES